MFRLRAVVLCCVGFVGSCVDANESSAVQSILAKDSIGEIKDSSQDANLCLEGLSWSPQSFRVTLDGAEASADQRVVRFPSAIPTGDDVNDLVALQWYVAHVSGSDQRARPAMIVVHESGSAMTVGRLFAKTLSLYGIHAFLIHLPQYGLRKGDGKRDAKGDLITRMRQSVSDVRRARDAIAVLPGIDSGHVSLQGTSLGGFVATLAGSLDTAFENVFITLAGGDFHSLLINGEKDTAKVRKELANAGYTGERLQRLVQQVEPLRIAHRLQPQRTWMFSGSEDRVVPLANAKLLAKCAQLPDEHHVIVPANHYTAIAFFPVIIDQMVRRTLPAELLPAEMQSQP